MASIINKDTVAQHLRSGIKAISSYEAKKIKNIEEEIAEQLSVSVYTIRSWTAQSNIPNTIETEQLLAMVWLILARSEEDLDWFVELLKGTELVIESVSQELVRAYFKRVRLKGKPLADNDIDRVTTRLFTNRCLIQNKVTDDLTLEESKNGKVDIFFNLISEKVKPIRKYIFLIVIFSIAALTILFGLTTFHSQDTQSSVCLDPTTFDTPMFLPDQGYSLYQSSDDLSKGSILSNHVRAIGIGPTDLWVGYIPNAKGVDAISYLDKENKTWAICSGLHLSSGQNVNDFAFRGDSVFVATDGAGIAELTKGHWQFYTTEDGLPNNSIYSLSIDKRDDLWATTYEGVAKLVGRHWTVVYQGNIDGLRSNHVYQFLDDTQGNRWFALIDRGIARLTSTGEWRSYFTDDQGLSNVRGITLDNAGGVWFATDGGGIIRFYNENWLVFNVAKNNFPSDEVQDVKTDQFGRIWGATNKGVVFTSDNGNSWVTHSTLNTTNIEFGCDKCVYGPYDTWLVIKDKGIANVRIPPLRPTVSVISVPKNVKLRPGEEYIFQIAVKVLAESLRVDDGDSLRASSSLDAPLYGAYSIIPVQKDVEQGLTYIFSNIDNPIIAPSAPGKYKIMWRVWQGRRFVTDPIQVEFEVVGS